MAAQSIAFVELYTGGQETVVDYLGSALGFTAVAESTDPESHSVLLRQGRMQVVVTAGPRTEPFLEAHGDGIADIALACDDVAASRAAAIAAGATDAGTVIPSGTAVDMAMVNLSSGQSAATASVIAWRQTCGEDPTATRAAPGEDNRTTAY